MVPLVVGMQLASRKGTHKCWQCFTYILSIVAFILHKQSEIVVTGRVGPMRSLL